MAIKMQEESKQAIGMTYTNHVNINKIVLAIDASPLSKIATEEAVQFAARLGAGIQALYVEDDKIKKMASHAYVRTVSPFVASSQTFDEEAVKTITKLQISKARSYLDHAISGLNIQYTFEIKNGNVHEEIMQAAKSADLLIMGWSGWQTTNLYGSANTKNSSSFKIIKLGNNAKNILNSIDTSILMIRGKFESSLPIITAFDGTETSEKTLLMAASVFQASRDRREENKENRRHDKKNEPERRRDGSLLTSLKQKTKKITSNIINNCNSKRKKTKDEITIFLLIDEIDNTIALESKANEILRSMDCKANFIPLPSVHSSKEFEKIFIPPLHLMTGGILVLSAKSPLYGTIKPASMTNEMLNSIPCSLLLVN
ncbi:MAG: universal stress protein [Alphaproteobacteria bacterium]|nr:universal stress protein [Alphaproteobacteria bacterium]